MELDDLKQSWQKATERAERPNRDVQEMLQNRSEGPVAQLKRRFRKGLLLMPALVGISFFELHADNTISWLVRGYLLVFCFLMLIYFYLSYRLVSKMQNMHETVKANLQRQVELLKTGLKWRLLITRSMFLLYAILLEVFMYVRPNDGLSNWRAHSLPFRLCAYAGAFIAGYLISKYATNHRYKKQITYLEQLVAQMQ